MSKQLVWLFLLALPLFWSLGDRAAAQDSVVIPLYQNLSQYHRTVTTASDQAQKYFDQGLTLYYGFNHEAAIKSFRQAVKLDPSCAMAYWGQAISAGPNINNPSMDSSAKAAAWQTVLEAKEHVGTASPVERRLIEALTARYAFPAPEDRRPLDSAYANAMRAVYAAYPDDPDVGALFADAMMNLRPWDLWEPGGAPKPGTPEIVATLEHVMSLVPDHPGACHFYVHTMEASPTPERALPAADRLRNRIPGAGHLVHMPSHIDIRVGHYAEAIKANERGIEADSTWIPAGGIYTMYRAHNYHFLAYAAMFDGQKKVALGAAQSMLDQVPMELVRTMPDFLDGFLAAPIHVRVRFGMWEDLLKLPAPPEDLFVTRAFWHYGRTVALAALGRVKEAEAENDSLRKAYERIPLTRTIGNNPAQTVLLIGLPMAEGELEFRKGNFDKAFSLLRLAVQRDDSLRYDEPWGWMMPVRHSLGALLTEHGLYKEAIDVYKADLKQHPGNGWALRGLANCYHLSGRHDEAAKTEELFREAWKRSDVPLTTSCFCSSKGV